MNMKRSVNACVSGTILIAISCCSPSIGVREGTSSSIDQRYLDNASQHSDDCLLPYADDILCNLNIGMQTGEFIDSLTYTSVLYSIDSLTYVIIGEMWSEQFYIEVTHNIITNIKI